jgi:hypothetical protein
VTRDPRLDPHPGDVLIGTGTDGVQRYVQVQWVEPERIGCYSVVDFGQEGERFQIRRDRYLAQAQNAEVLLAAAVSA